MPREVMVEWISELSGQPVGSRSLRYGVDADEFVKKGLAKIVDEFPPPRHFLLNDKGELEIGVMSSNQAKQSEQERKDEQTYLQAQVKNLDSKHAREMEEKRIRELVEKKRLEVSRG